MDESEHGDRQQQYELDKEYRDSRRADKWEELEQENNNHELAEDDIEQDEDSRQIDQREELELENNMKV